MFTVNILTTPLELSGSELHELNDILQIYWASTIKRYSKKIIGDNIVGLCLRNFHFSYYNTSTISWNPYLKQLSRYICKAIYLPL